MAIYFDLGGGGHTIQPFFFNWQNFASKKEKFKIQNLKIK
jgi:hypothetical protein